MATLKRRNSFSILPPYQYVIIECITEQVYALEKFTISGLAKHQLDALSATFDYGLIVDSCGNHFPNNIINRSGGTIPVTAILNFLSRKYNFCLKGSAIVQRNGSSYRERFIMEKYGQEQCVYE